MDALDWLKRRCWGDSFEVTGEALRATGAMFAGQRGSIVAKGDASGIVQAAVSEGLIGGDRGLFFFFFLLSGGGYFQDELLASGGGKFDMYVARVGGVMVAETVCTRSRTTASTLPRKEEGNDGESYAAGERCWMVPVSVPN